MCIGFLDLDMSLMWPSFSQVESIIGRVENLVLVIIFFWDLGNVVSLRELLSVPPFQNVGKGDVDMHCGS